MYNNDDIQAMIDKVNNDGIQDQIVNCIVFGHDRASIRRVLHEGFVEAFDRYDSDVCEKFIRAYEKIYC